MSKGSATLSEIAEEVVQPGSEATSPNGPVGKTTVLARPLGDPSWEAGRVELTVGFPFLLIMDGGHLKMSHEAFFG